MATHTLKPIEALDRLGAAEVLLLEEVGATVRLCLDALGCAARFGVCAGALVTQLYHQLVTSAPIILVTGFFVGMVLAYQTSIEYTKFGIVAYIADIVCVSLLRELAPVLCSLVLAGRVGSGIAAEVGAMAISDQVDAMRMLSLSVTRHLTAPRILAAAAACLVLCGLFDLVGVGGGYLIGVYDTHVPFHTYHSHTLSKFRFADLTCGLAKALFFGLVIGTVGCANGLATRGGAAGVGERTRRAVVTASVVILVSDFFLTRALMAILT